MAGDRLSVILLALGVACGCSSDKDHAPQTGIGGPFGGSGSGAGGGSSEGGLDAVAPDAPAGAKVEGEVVVLTDDTFASDVPFVGQADVIAQAATGLWVVTTASSSETFELSGILPGASVWMGVWAKQGGQQTLRTLVPVNTQSTSPKVLPALQGAVLDEIYPFLTTPLVRSVTRAQLVVLVRDAKAPIEGAKLTVPTAEAVLYDDGVHFSDLTESTGVNGIGIAVNVEAVSWPGSEQSITVDSGSAIVGVEVELAADAVTIVTVAFD